MISREDYLMEMRNPKSFLRPSITKGLMEALPISIAYWVRITSQEGVKIEIEDELESMRICFLSSYDFACLGSKLVNLMIEGDIPKVHIMRELFLVAMSAYIEYFSRHNDFTEEKILEVFHHYLELFGEKGTIHGSAEEVDNASKAGDKERILAYFKSIGFSIRNSDKSERGSESN